MRRTFSVVEKGLIVIGFLVILGGLYSIYVMGSRYLRMAQTQSQLQQQAALAVHRVVQELSLSVDEPQAVRVGKDPACLWFLSARAEPRAGKGDPPFDTDGQLQWQEWVGFFLDSRQFTRAQTPLEGAPLKRPFGLVAQPSLDDFRRDPEREVVADAVETFMVAHTAAGLYSLRVITALPIDGRQTCRMQLDTEVYLLNSP